MAANWHKVRIPLPEGESPKVRAVLAGPVAEAIVSRLRHKYQEHSDTGAAMAGWEPGNSIRYPYLGDQDTLAIINTQPQAYWIEEGRAGFHLASRWGARGGQWKISKDGELYAHVPFRVPTPLDGGVKRSSSSKRRRLGVAMPRAVYEMAKQLQTGRKTLKKSRSLADAYPGVSLATGGAGNDRLVGFGDTHKRGVSYDYYRGVFGDLPSELDDVVGYEWKASQFEGMFRDTAATPGGGRHTEYMTIRTITPKSKGWYIPPTKPHRYVEEVMRELGPMIDRLVADAAAQDAAANLAQATEGL